METGVQKVQDQDIMELTNFPRLYSSYFHILILLFSFQGFCDGYNGNICGGGMGYSSIGSGMENFREQKLMNGAKNSKADNISTHHRGIWRKYENGKTEDRNLILTKKRFPSATTTHGLISSAFTIVGDMKHYYISYESSDIEDGENVLFGWLSVTVKLPYKIRGVYLQSYTTYPPSSIYKGRRGMFAPGELVWTRFNSACRENIDGTDGSFQKVYMAPCYYTISPSFFVPYGAAVAHEYENIRFTFRSDFPECAPLNSFFQLEFRHYGSQGGDDDLFAPNQMKVQVSKHAYGGYDPEPPRFSDKVKCDAKNLLKERHLPAWITAYNQDSMVQDADTPKPNPIYEDSKCDYNQAEGAQRFRARCNIFTANEDNGYMCTRTYDDRNYTVGGPAHGPYEPDQPLYPTDGRPCGGCTFAKNITRTFGVSANSQVGKMLWGLRASHGICMTLSTMLVLPFGFLLARYYKDSFMAYRYVNMHLWYGIHIGTSMAGFAGLVSGWAVALIGSRFFGWSTHPISWVHRLSGYFSFILFVLGIGSGPFRKFVRGGRILTIFLHFLFGDAARILFDICLLTSFYIPGSPSSKNDIQVQGFAMELNAFIVIVWIVVDLAVHVFLQIHTTATDKHAKMPKARSYAVVVPIPLLRPSVEKDVPGTGLRKVVLVVHTGVGLLCAGALTYIICFSDPYGRFYGRMSYTHKPSGKLNFLMPDMVGED